VVNNIHITYNYLIICIKDTPRRKYNVFIGGGIIANLAMNNKDSTYWITKKEYQECGGEYCMKKI